MGDVKEHIKRLKDIAAQRYIRASSRSTYGMVHPDQEQSFNDEMADFEALMWAVSVLEKADET